MILKILHIIIYNKILFNKILKLDFYILVYKYINNILKLNRFTKKYIRLFFVDILINKIDNK